MNLFKSKIKCKLCGQNYKHSMERKQSVYICSGYANYGKNYCSRRKVKEDDLLFLIKVKVPEITFAWVQENVVSILVGGESEIEVTYTDGSKAILKKGLIIR